MNGKTIILASLATSIGIGFAAHAQLPNPSYSQDFSGYDNQFDRPSWGLIDPIPFDFQTRGVKAVDKPNYTQSGDIEFDVRWTRKTLKTLLGDNFAPLKNTIGIRGIRQAFNAPDSPCKAKLEVGKDSIYDWAFTSGYAAELDSDRYDCGDSIVINGQPYPLDRSNNPSSIRVRTFIPTIPGATYSFDIHYNKRLGAPHHFDDNDALIVKVQAKSFESVVLDGIPTPIEDDTFEGGRITLPFDVNTTTYNGYYKATITFVAQHYFTRIIMRGTDDPDSYGVIIDKVASSKISVPQGPFQMCSMFYQYGSKNFKKCMHGKNDDLNFACDFNNVDPNSPNSVRYIINKPGIHTPGNPQRYQPINMASQTRIDGNGSLGTFYSVGLEGKTTVKLNCPVGGKSIVFNEFTNGVNQDINSYPERGKVKAKIKCLDPNNDNDGWILLTRDSTDVNGTEDNFLLTNEYISYDFNAEDYKGCRMTKLVFIDKTTDLPNAPNGTDGIEIQGLKFVPTPP
ncbi:hypothetical protein HGP28_07235 [Vibrio sp. SM6]|uniref:Adhesin n=1 Tax=Vibrio agarilyticus TaxID=2726741 RepID=A0A7X8YG85_9VIBR|nr:hypothetical protein [Vibrio agarilyticus]NLS12698.1 hypothetical protein [Vibrio agarilyticus]